MAEKMPQEKAVALEDVVVSNAFEIAALITVLENKGIITKAEILEEINKLNQKIS